MISTLISFDGRAARRSSLMLVAVASLAACTDDSPVAPPMPTAASMAKGTKGVTTAQARQAWAAVDMNQVLVGGAVFTWNDGTGPIQIADNSALDLDKTPGRFEVLAPPQGGVICTLVAPKGWIFPGTGCAGIPAVPGQTTFVTSFAVTPEYSVSWYTHDSFTLVGPATYTVKGVSVKYAATIVDDGQGDRYMSLGKLWAQLPAAGDYTICQVKAAPNTTLADPACKTVSTNLGEVVNGGFFISKPIDTFFMGRLADAF